MSRMQDLVNKVNGPIVPPNENNTNTLDYNLNKTKHASNIQANWNNPNTLNYNLNKTKHASNIRANWNMVEGFHRRGEKNTKNG